MFQKGSCSHFDVHDVNDRKGITFIVMTADAAAAAAGVAVVVAVTQVCDRGVGDGLILFTTHAGIESVVCAEVGNG